MKFIISILPVIICTLIAGVSLSWVLIKVDTLNSTESYISLDRIVNNSCDVKCNTRRGWPISFQNDAEHRDFDLDRYIENVLFYSTILLLISILVSYATKDL